MTDNTQPEALRLAEILEGDYCPDWFYEQGVDEVAAELRRQHTRIAELESELEAVGAGGVSGPLVGRAAPPTAQAEAENLRKALQFYADKEHFAIAEEGAWDTVSGEPQNYWCDEAGTAMVEDGSIAKMALAGQLINFSDEDEDESAPPTSAEGVEHAD